MSRGREETQPTADKALLPVYNRRGQGENGQDKQILNDGLENII